MFKKNLTLLLLFSSCFIFAQNKNETILSKSTFTQKASKFWITPELRTIKPFEEIVHEGDRAKIIGNNLRRYKHVNPNALPKGNDPVWQQQKGGSFNKAPIQNWQGTNFNAFPPDPSGAVGPNHYVHMVNSTYTVYDKTGTSLGGPYTLGSLLGGSNDGDPIVMYDVDADRWFLSQFKFSNSSFQVAVSQTADPLGAYYAYEFPLNSFPDYPKYSVWGNAYYVSANKSAPQLYALERIEMLAGNPNAQIIGFNVPSLSTNGFFSILPAHATSGAPSSNTPGYTFYFQDDGWGGVSSDNIKIWEINLDWNTTSNSTIASPQVLPVSAFDSEFTASWDDIEQPGTSSKLDGIPTAFMYMAQYREFPTYSSVVLNHTVDVDGTNHAGIRWYELRKSGANPWTVHQEGTFAPDGESRWLGSICMDYQGNMGLAYSVSGPTVFPSIRYTGRYFSDPLGQMTLAEEDIINGNGIQTGTNRWGDYAQMTLDPTDEATFWYTGEYILGGRKSRIASFKIANDFNNDIGVTSIDNPTNGALTANENITVNITNFGVTDQSNFPVSYTLNGGTPVNETFSGTLAAGTSSQYTFTSLANFGTPGNYDVISYSGLSNDQFNFNDTTFKTIQHLYPDDVGITNVLSPVTNNNLTSSEVVTVNIENFGTIDQSNFPVNYSINGGALINETYTGTIAAGGSATYNFTTTADLSALGNYSFTCYSSLSSDADLLNDTSYTTVVNELCQPFGDCSFGDGFTKFNLGTINNNTGCSPDGYGDYTNLSTDLEQASVNTLSIQSGYANQSGTIWIDFNDNFTFESSEIVILNTAFGTSISDVDLTIDANADLGQHLLRARTNWSQFGQAVINDPCVDVTYGETEDYTVNIIANSGSGVGTMNYGDLEILVNQISNAEFEITVPGLPSEAEIKIHNTIGQKVFSSKINETNNVNFKINLSSQATGYYLIHIGNSNINLVKKIVVD